MRLEELIKLKIDLPLATAICSRRGIVGTPVRFLGNGFDSHAFDLDNGSVLRIAHRCFGHDALRLEGQLVPKLPHGIGPKDLRFFRADREFPFGASTHKKVSGESLEEVASTNIATATQVGETLNRLHSAAPPNGLPPDQIRRSDLLYRVKKIEATILKDPTLYDDYDVDRLLDVARELSTSPTASELRWVHGDLYARHAYVSDNICRFIDWGDSHLGDPALDLSIAFGTFTGEARGALLDAYRLHDTAMVQRARFRAIHHGVLMLRYPADDGITVLAKRMLEPFRRD